MYFALHRGPGVATTIPAKTVGSAQQVGNSATARAQADGAAPTAAAPLDAMEDWCDASTVGCAWRLVEITVASACTNGLALTAATPVDAMAYPFAARLTYKT